MFVKTVYLNGLMPDAASSLVQLSSQFVSDIVLEHGYMKINAKSILGLLAIGSLQGEVTLKAQGIDEYEAIKTIGAFFEQGKPRSA